MSRSDPNGEQGDADPNFSGAESRDSHCDPGDGPANFPRGV